MLTLLALAPLALAQSDHLGVHTSTLDAADDAMPDGSRIEVFAMPARAGERLRYAAVSSHYDLRLVLIPPGGEPIEDTNHAPSGSPAWIDHVASVTAEHELGVIGQGPEAVGEYQLLVARPLTGSLSEQIATFDVADPWSLPGIEDTRAREGQRKRVLLDTVAPAHDCAVVAEEGGPVTSCWWSLEVDGRKQAQKEWKRMDKEWRIGHPGWSFSEEEGAASWTTHASQGQTTHTLHLLYRTNRGWTARVSTHREE